MTDSPVSLVGAEVLTEAECRQLLATVPVGRLVFHEGGLPAVRLVNFVMDGGEVVFRTSAGQKFGAILRGDVMGFEADQYEADTHRGWMVTLVGRAWTITDPGELDRVAQLPLRPWASGLKPHLVRLEGEHLRGLRLPPGEI
jgi:nitroimidazol reductase NimA-like FMN-containing flavoprotein (pyridoxamine 5'-phosphate oxidase superfamily)